MVSSAQLKLVLENSWNLETLEKEEAISQLRVMVKRSHLKSEIRSQTSGVG
jgi:CMP-2-keto-3-deoxyoctulosonic acid synthetase